MTDFPRKNLERNSSLEKRMNVGNPGTDSGVDPESPGIGKKGKQMEIASNRISDAGPPELKDDDIPLVVEVGHWSSVSSSKYSCGGVSDAGLGVPPQFAWRGFNHRVSDQPQLKPPAVLPLSSPSFLSPNSSLTGSSPIIPHAFAAMPPNAGSLLNPLRDPSMEPISRTSTSFEPPGRFTGWSPTAAREDLGVSRARGDILPGLPSAPGQSVRGPLSLEAPQKTRLDQSPNPLLRLDLRRGAFRAPRKRIRDFDSEPDARTPVAAPAAPGSSLPVPSTTRTRRSRAQSVQGPNGPLLGEGSSSTRTPEPKIPRYRRPSLPVVMGRTKRAATTQKNPEVAPGGLKRSSEVISAKPETSFVEPGASAVGPVPPIALEQTLPGQPLGEFPGRTVSDISQGERSKTFQNEKLPSLAGGLIPNTPSPGGSSGALPSVSALSRSPAPPGPVPGSQQPQPRGI
eukprot:CAMPEP_0184743068 /NCGR_PEP_ID=MMETSP0315-20130426/5940_1 /TAXON_ID=101924 /ORGANISM="Rhodosorus marinus, Strain UTEX LB 2760" /LENGTH=455 /DNA_ID=CAMNT_0027214155 /DNA_START=461 /DNA_END=1828 /DNA_ORIENTATION=+